MFKNSMSYIEGVLLRLTAPNIFKKNLNLAEEDDFFDLLKAEGISEKVSGGNMICAYCGEPITVKSIAGIQKGSSDITFFCENCAGRSDLQ